MVETCAVYGYKDAGINHHQQPVQRPNTANCLGIFLSNCKDRSLSIGAQNYVVGSSIVGNHGNQNLCKEMANGQVSQIK